VLEDRLRRSLRATFFGMGVNVLLAGGKLTAGIFGHSHALVADAIESLADIFSSVVVWRGLVLAARPADKEHPYGHGKAEPITAAIVATMLLLAAVSITLTSLEAIRAPRSGPEPFTLLVLAAVVAIKEALFRYVIKEATSVDSSAVRSDAWHHRSDAITSSAAAIGISVALLGGRGYESADDIAAMVAAGIIGWNGWRLLRPALDELMDTAPDEMVRENIRDLARGVTGVNRVEKCIVRKMGYSYFVDMHVEVDPQMTVQQAHNIAHQVKDQVRLKFPAVYDVLVHIEPGQIPPFE
jgi:cation diffusion facilitator family transporter